MLSEKTKDIVKATAPVLREHGVTLTTHFYNRMFEHNPEVAPYFNPANQAAGKQPKALAGAVAAYAENIDNLEALGAAVELIAQKHAALMVKAEHYPIVGENLLASIKEVLGDAATDDVIEAWAEAYGFLADILIGRERQIYTHSEERPGGWEGFKPFKVARKVEESEIVTSFHLVPEDGGALPDFEPGQYVTVRVPSDETGTQMRNYSLSAAPGGDALRISVKLEGPVRPDLPGGLASSRLHNDIQEGDLVDLGPPCGEFVLGEDKEEQRPLVFMAAGIGITPLLPMAKAALEDNPKRRIVFLHCCRNEAVQPLGGELEALAAAHEGVSVHFRYSDEMPSANGGPAARSQGMLDDEILEEIVPGDEGEGEPSFYFCGPEPFMLLAHRLLSQRGVPAERTKFEFFGPLQSLDAA